MIRRFIEYIYLIIKEMRRGFSPTKAKQEFSYGKERDEPRRINPSVNYWKYFCHYNNAVYQGGMNAYKKHGKGLLLHDDGAAVVTQYLHDTISGHNIIFRENSITSVLIKSNAEYQIAYKVAKCIIKIPFMDKSQKPHGLGLLIDYQTFKIYQLIFKKGVIVEKILHLQRRSNDDAFRNNTIAKLIGLKHQKAFDLTFQKPQTMHVRYNNNQLIIGYHDQDGDIKGLAFKMYAQNVDISGQKSLYLKYIQRGYYKHSTLQTYGEKYFSNGNKYIGQFLQGQFVGDGILVCPQEMKWVYGQFKEGKLNKVIDSNNKKYTQNNFQMWNKWLLQVHQKYRERYIDFNIELPEELFIHNILKKSLKMPVTEVDPDYQESMKEEQYRMSRIQQQFLQGSPGDSQRSFVDLQLQKHYIVKSNKANKPFESQRVRNKNYQEQVSKNNKHIYIEERQQYPNDRTRQRQQFNKTKQIKPIYTTKNKQKEAEQQYRMKDPFQIQLIKVPYEQPELPRQIKTPKDRLRLQEKYFQPKIQKEAQTPKDRVRLQERSIKPTLQADRYSSHSSKQRKYSPVSNYYSTKSYQGLYSHNYQAELQRKRQKYRRMELDDSQYMKYLRYGIQRSPYHRNYYRTPPRQINQRHETNPNRYNGKIVNKKTFNYKEPTAESIGRYSPSRHTRLRDSSKDSSSLDKNSPLAVSRSSPYKITQSKYRR